MREIFPVQARFAGAADAQAYARVALSERLGAGDLVGLFVRSAREHETARAIRFLPDGLPDDKPKDFTFSQLLDRLHRTVITLHSLGVEPQDVVALLVPNHPLTVTAVLGAQTVGVAAPINRYLEAAEIAALIDAMNAKILVADGAMMQDKLPAVRAACRCKPRVLSLQDLDRPGASGAASNGGADFPPEHRDAHVVALFATGGTTGLPKLVPLTGRNLAAMALMSAYAYGFGPKDVVLAAMPMFHVGGLLASALFPLVCGAQIVLAGEEGYRGNGTVASTWALAQQHALSVLTGPPTVMGQLVQAMPPRASVPALRLLINGAAALPVAVGEQLVAGMGVALTEPWGLTEATLAVTSMPREGERRAGSVGVALPYCAVKAVRLGANGEELNDCVDGEIGVLAIRGPSVFAGYLNLPAESQPWLKGGWLNTGDLGRVDADGYVWITGRAKDLIKRGGHGIDPAGIEAAIYAHPDVALAAAVGRPDAYAGELPVVYVQLKPGREVPAQALLDLATGSIPERAAVPKEIYIVPAMPVTGVGKINKQALRLDAARRTFEQVLQEIDGLRDRFQLIVEAHARFGSLVTAQVPPEHVEIVRATLGRFAMRAEVRAAFKPGEPFA